MGLIKNSLVVGTFAVLALGQANAGVALALDTPAGAAQDAAVASLVAAINAEIAKLGSGASQQDVEGAIAIAIDNAHQPDAVVAAALEQVAAGAPAGSAVKSAANTVASARKRSGGGTGGIGGSPDLFGANGGPAVSVGGGTSNYTPPSP